MTAMAYAPPYSDPPSIHTQSRAASSAGQKLAGQLYDFAAHARNNATDWRRLTNSLIEEIARECERPNWDGYGAQPVTRDAKEQAQRFIDLLPYRLPAPEPVPDVDGELSLTWDFGPGHVFTVSVGPDGTLTYAGLLGGGAKRHGVDRFGSEVPKVILQAVEELCERSNAAA